MSLFSQRINQAYGIVTLPEDVKIDMLMKFAILADELAKGSKSSLIMNNIDCYNAICNREVMYMLRYDKQANYYIRTVTNFPKINSILGTASNIENTLSALKGIVNTNNNLDKDAIILALRSFGVKEVESVSGDVDIIDTNDDELKALEDALFEEELKEQEEKLLEEDLKALEDALENQIEDYEDPEDIERYNGEHEIYDEDEKDPLDDYTEEPEEDEEKTIESSKEIEGENDNDNDNELDKPTYSDEFAEVWSDEIESSVIAGLMASFRALYESCYSGITSPDGILTDDGILAFEKPIKGTTKAEETSADAKHKAEIHGNNRVFMMNHGRLNQAKSYTNLYKAIMYAYGVSYGDANPLTNTSVEEQKRIVNKAVQSGENIFGRIIDGRKDAVPKWADVSIGNFMYPKLHEEYMTGYLKINRKLEKWASENKVHKNSARITSYDSMEKWIKKSLLDCILQALHDYTGPNGSKITINSDTVDILPVCQKIASSIKNIIAVTANKKGYRTVKICSNISGIDENLIADKIADYLNWSTAGSQAIKVVAKGNIADVIELDIITDEKAYNSSSSFASSVIDDILASGQLPSWSNALLGEKNTGGAFTYNFKTRNSISIYGSSGSGKGIMTSALLSNALIDNCYVFYFDGKPDNGAALGKVAWDKHAGDAPVFNGLQGGSNTFPEHLELYSHGIRPVSWRSICDECIPYIESDPNDYTRPEFPFNNELNRTLLKEVSYTLMAFQFVHDMILLRTEPQYVKDRWAVFVIDEIQDAAMNEKKLRNIMAEYLNAVGETPVTKTEVKTDKNGNVTTSEKRDGKIKDRKNWSKDTGYMFCQQWIGWADNLCNQWDNVVTKSLRNSSSTLITIFQSNAWLTQDNKGAGKTKIGTLMLKVAAKTTKIVGKGALVSANQWGDDTKYDWVDETSKGKWVIASDESGLKNSDQVFRPFKCFTTDLGPDVAVTQDDFGAGADQCRKFKGDKGKDPVGLQSYLNYLFNGMQSEIDEQIRLGNRLPNSNSAEQVLVSSFEYFESILKTSGKKYANDEYGLLHYMYTIPCIVNNGTYNGESDVPLENEDGEQEYTSDMQRNVDIYNQGLDNQQGFFEEDEEDDIDLVYPDSDNNGHASTFTQNTGLEGFSEYEDVAKTFQQSEQTSGFQFDVGDEEEEDIDLWGENSDIADMYDQHPDEIPIDDDVIIEDEYQEPIDFRQVYGDAYFKPEQMPINNSSTAESFGKNNRQYKIKPDNFSHAWDLNENNCIIASMPEYDTSERFNNRFFRTIKGTEWEFDRRWKMILKSISARVSSKDLITKVELREDEMKVNGRFVALRGLVGGFENIEFKDLVNFKMLYKEFKNISELTLDTIIYTQATLETADGDVTKYLFTLMPRLQNLRIVNGRDGVNISRNGFRSVEERRKAEQMQQEAVFRQQFKAMSSSQDPKFSQRSPGDQRNSFRAINIFPEDIRGTAADQFRRSSKSFLSGTTHTIGTIGAIAIGGIAGTIAGVWRWINKR